MTEPMRPRDRAPGDRSHLERLLSEWADQAAVPAGRLRRTVGVTVVMSMLETCQDAAGAPLFIFAGGAAMECWRNWLRMMPSRPCVKPASRYSVSGSVTLGRHL